MAEATFLPSTHETARHAAIAHRRALLAILALGTALRLALFLWTWVQSPDLSTLHSPDTAAYVKPAEALLNQGRFYVDNQPEVFHTPGYPLLLLPGLALHQLELVTFCIQLLLSVATIWLVYRMASELSGDRLAALGAGLLVAIEPLAIIYTSALLSETLFTFVFVLFLRYLLRYLSKNSSLDLALAGMLLAAATFVRPVSYYLPIVVLAGLTARAFWLRQPRLRLAQCGVFALACIVPLAAWQTRNASVAGYGAFSASGDFNLYFHQAAWAVAQRTGQTLEAVQHEFGGPDVTRFNQAHPELRDASLAERYSFMRREGKRLLGENLPDWAKAETHNALRIALNPGGTSFLQLASRTPVPRPHRSASEGIFASIRRMAVETPLLFFTSLVLGLTVGVTYLLSGLGWIASLRRRPWEMLALLGIGGYLIGVSAGVVEARMRHPVMPILCLLGGIGISTIGRWTVLGLVPAATTRRLRTLQYRVFQQRISPLAADCDSMPSLHVAPLAIVEDLPAEHFGLHAAPMPEVASITSESGKSRQSAQ